MKDKTQVRQEAAEENSQGASVSLEEAVRARTHELRLEIQEHQLAEASLRETEAEIRQMVNSAVDGIITADEKGKILSFNTAAEKIFGYSAIEITGQNVSKLMPQNSAEKHDMYMARYMKSGVGKVIGMVRELVARRKDGTTFLADFSINLFRHRSTVTFVGIIRDITARKQEQYRLQGALEQLQNTQEDLVQAEKMASLGSLVAGVAHEINTPIGVSVTAVSHLKDQAEKMAKVFADGQLSKSDLDRFVKATVDTTAIIQTNLDRASDLIRSFKQVAVDQASDQKRQINILDYIEEILASLKPALRRCQHKVTVQGDRDLVVDTHPGALAQVITNLVMNSLTHAYDDDEVGHIQIIVEKHEKSFSLLYADDGKGMDEEVSRRVFDPFFTTNRGGGGSGLGMHILFNQVKQTLGGTIELHSIVGKGTAFEINIPYQSDMPNGIKGETK